mmetsp:Transcript_1954/g.4142  ORF Transcript_1954/g.4142 Transcript_1954/m.4142 type:complete len:273 (+) Transcript_1954:1081-1899(+)
MPSKTTRSISGSWALRVRGRTSRWPGPLKRRRSPPSSSKEGHPRRAARARRAVGGSRISRRATCPPGGAARSSCRSARGTGTACPSGSGRGRRTSAEPPSPPWAPRESRPGTAASSISDSQQSKFQSSKGGSVLSAPPFPPRARVRWSEGAASPREPRGAPREEKCSHASPATSKRSVARACSGATTGTATRFRVAPPMASGPPGSSACAVSAQAAASCSASARSCRRNGPWRRSCFRPLCGGGVPGGGCMRCASKPGACDTPSRKTPGSPR